MDVEILKPGPPLSLIPNFLKSFFLPVYPRNVISISADYVAAVRGGKSSVATIEGSAHIPLAPGVVVPSHSKVNIIDPAALHRALVQAVERAGLSRKEVNLLIPDVTARVFLIPLETLPGKPADLEQLLRFKVKKSVPFAIEEAAVSYQVQTLSSSHYEVILTTINRDILHEYENAVGSVGLEPGFVTVEHFGVAQLLDRQSQDWRSRSTLLFRLSPRSFTSSIYHQGALRFYRSVEKGWGPFSKESPVTVEMMFDEIYPSLAYFQDKFESKVQLIYFSGLPAGGDRICAALQKLAECPVAEVRTERVVGGGLSQMNPEQLNQVFSPLIGMELGAT
jgi:type IV pilus assembly protein PilM